MGLPHREYAAELTRTVTDEITSDAIQELLEAKGVDYDHTDVAEIERLTEHTTETDQTLLHDCEAFDPDTRRRVGEWFAKAAKVHDEDGNTETARHATWAAAVFGAYEAAEDDYSEADG